MKAPLLIVVIMVVLFSYGFHTGVFHGPAFPNNANMKEECFKNGGVEFQENSSSPGRSVCIYGKE